MRLTGRANVAQQYNYVNLDDCVFTGRGADGNLVPDPVRFKSGITALADYVHSLGLKFGLYTDAGRKTCQGRPGLYGYDELDTKYFADHGGVFGGTAVVCCCTRASE